MKTFDTPIRYTETRADNNKAWEVEYRLSSDGSSVLVTVDVFLDGYDPGRKQKVIWEKGIERIWNGQALFDDGTDLYPVVFNFRYVPSGQEMHTVTVHKGSGVDNATDWYLTQKDLGPDYADEVAAHEFGHMIGNFDEYQGGATLGGFTTTGTLMSELVPDGFERYFWGIESKTEYFGYGDLSGTALSLVLARNGDDGPDKMKGKEVTEAFYSLGGDDKVAAAGGRDFVDGGSGDDLLKGDAGSDRMFGKSGDDRLVGGAAVDTLDGGSGNDRYYFDGPPTTSGPDIVKTFTPGGDRIYLDDKVFPALEKGKLPAKFFFIGEEAAGKNDHIGYDPSTGALLYDGDGVDAPGDLDIDATIIAYLPKGLGQFSHADVFIY